MFSRHYPILTLLYIHSEQNLKPTKNQPKNPKKSPKKTPQNHPKPQLRNQTKQNNPPNPKTTQNF